MSGDNTTPTPANGNGNGGVIKVTLEHIASRIDDLKGDVGDVKKSVSDLDEKVGRKTAEMWVSINKMHEFCADHSRTVDAKLAAHDVSIRIQEKNSDGMAGEVKAVSTTSSRASGGVVAVKEVATIIIAALAMLFAAYAAFVK